MSRLYPAEVYFAARIACEANRVYCEMIGDQVPATWDQTDAAIKNSMLDGVEYVRTHSNASPEQQHNNWMMSRLEDGWSYGPVKDVDNKRHPNLVPYHQLPVQQQTKDTLFRCAVIAALRSYHTGGRP